MAFACGTIAIGFSMTILAIGLATPPPAVGSTAGMLGTDIFFFVLHTHSCLSRPASHAACACLMLHASRLASSLIHSMQFPCSATSGRHQVHHDACRHRVESSVQIYSCFCHSCPSQLEINHMMASKGPMAAHFGASPQQVKSFKKFWIALLVLGQDSKLMWSVKR